MSPPPMAAFVLLGVWVLVLFAATNAAAYSQWRATRGYGAVDSTEPYDAAELSYDDAANPSCANAVGPSRIDSRPPESTERARDDRSAYGRRDDVGAVADD